jgi:hypothetical protein
LDTNQAYYSSDGVRFDCASSTQLVECAKRLVDYCSLVNQSSATPATESSDDDDGENGCNLATPRSHSTPLAWGWLAPLAGLLLRRRAHVTRS